METLKPWGRETLLSSSSKHWIKILYIKPGQRTSLQNHKNHNEVWTIVEGKAIITLDTEEFIVRKHDTVFVTEATKHRIYNYDKESNLIICEVATGTPLETDIFRYEDDYGRKQ